MENFENLLLVNNEGEEVKFYDYDPITKTLKYLAKNKTELNLVEVLLTDMHLGVQHGNIKVGKELILNTLPGDNFIKAKGLAITNVHGSCQGCCDGCEDFCYAIKGCVQHNNSVMPSVIKNLVLYREDRERFLSELRVILNKEVEKAAKKLAKEDSTESHDIVFRWHSSGEIENYQYLEDMMDIAKEFPTIHFYSYTKRFSYISQYLDKHGDFPKNFVWNLSVWKDNLKQAGFPDKYLSKVQLFEWDDLDDESLVNVVHCPTVEWDGKSKKGHLNHEPFNNGKERTCANCGMCWKGYFKGKKIAVYNH